MFILILLLIVAILTALATFPWDQLTALLNGEPPRWERYNDAHGCIMSNMMILVVIWLLVVDPHLDCHGLGKSEKSAPAQPAPACQCGAHCGTPSTPQAQAAPATIPATQPTTAPAPATYNINLNLPTPTNHPQ